MKKYVLQFSMVFGLFAATGLRGQGILVSFLNPASGNYEIGSFDLATCEYTTSVPDVNISFLGDFLVADNGNYYALGSGAPLPGGFSEATLYTIDPATGQTTFLIELGVIYLSGSILQLNATTLVIAMSDNIYLYDIPSNTLTLAGMIDSSHFPELFFYQGNVYMSALAPPTNTSHLIQINFSPFSATPIVQSILVGTTVGVCDNVFTLSGNFGGLSIVENNMGNNTVDMVCLGVPEFVGATPFSFSFAPDPDNASGPLCDCTTESGIITPPVPPLSYYTACGQNPIPIPHLGDETLDGDDALVFLMTTLNNLYQNYPNNVIHVYETPVATFIPGVTQVNVFYLIYPAASNAVPGSVDWDDLCLEIGSPIAIRWTTGPTVNFTLLSQDCTTGCRTVRANFTGTQPYILTYTVATDDGQTNTFTQNSTSSVFDLTICPPAGYSGELTVQATNLVDANCTCGP